MAKQPKSLVATFRGGIDKTVNPPEYKRRGRQFVTKRCQQLKGFAAVLKDNEMPEYFGSAWDDLVNYLGDRMGVSPLDRLLRSIPWSDHVAAPRDIRTLDKTRQIEYPDYKKLCEYHMRRKMGNIVGKGNRLPSAARNGEIYLMMRRNFMGEPCDEGCNDEALWWFQADQERKRSVRAKSS